MFINICDLAPHYMVSKAPVSLIFIQQVLKQAHLILAAVQEMPATGPTAPRLLSVVTISEILKFRKDVSLRITEIWHRLYH